MTETRGGAEAIEAEMGAPLRGSMRDWLQLGRVQTASLTSGVLLIGWLLGGGAADWRLAAWWGYGVLLHWLGFGLNGLLDVGHDREDPEKAHHPLVAGRIGVEAAWGVWFLAMMLTMLAAGLSLPGPALSALMGFVLWGYAYNLWSKEIPGADIFAGGAYACLPWVAYLTAGAGGGVQEMLLLSGALGLAVVFQNAVEGGVKDMRGDCNNPLQRLGFLLAPFPEGHVLLTSLRGQAVAWSLRVGTLGALLAMGVPWPLSPISPPGIAFWALTGGVLGLTWGFLRQGPYDHDRRLRQIALSEVFLWMLLVLAVHLAAPGRVGWSQVAVLVVVPALWFFALNYLLWGGKNIMAPKV